MNKLVFRASLLMSGVFNELRLVGLCCSYRLLTPAVGISPSLMRAAKVPLSTE